MHKKTCHILKANAGRDMPKWVIFFDTETKEEILDDKNKRLTLRLGHAILTRRTKDNNFRIVDSLDFTTSDAFHVWLDRVCVGRERFYLTAHNIGFDVRITDTLRVLTEQGWKRTLFIEEGLNFISRWRRNNTTLRIINNQQLFNTSLRSLGKSIGTYKEAVDFSTVSDADLLKYCQQDVEVMRQSWNVWVKFLAENNLGNFQITAASQAMSSFRHRFMKRPIYIHDNEKAIMLERDSYHGGRVECFHIGEYSASKVYCLDVNSMYPFVMKHKKVPTKLLKYYEKINRSQFEGVREKFGYIVEAELQCSAAVLPVVLSGRLLFPTGKIRGVFTKPELEYALRYATLESIGRCAVYHEEIIFSDYVDFFYTARNKFKAEGNKAFDYVSKILLNGLYGKFAQRQFEYKVIGSTRDMADGFYVSQMPGSTELCKLRVLNGVVERAEGYKEGFNSFVAIASFITAEARVYLQTLIEKAGRSNVLYCDTDSLFLTEQGLDRVKDDIAPGTLGKLKMEGVNDSITIRAPKWYEFGDKLTSKGIRRDAVLVSERVYEQDKFMSFRGAMRAQKLDGVIVSRVRKRLSNHYLKGLVEATGRVSPFELTAASYPAPPFL